VLAAILSIALHTYYMWLHSARRLQPPIFKSSSENFSQSLAVTQPNCFHGRDEKPRGELILFSLSDGRTFVLRSSSPSPFSPSSASRKESCYLISSGKRGEKGRFLSVPNLILFHFSPPPFLSCPFKEESIPRKSAEAI